jgi:hypothetical protein
MAKFKFGNTVYINKKDSPLFNDIAKVFDSSDGAYQLLDIKYGDLIVETFKESELEKYTGQNAFN